MYTLKIDKAPLALSAKNYMKAMEANKARIVIDDDLIAKAEAAGKTEILFEAVLGFATSYVIDITATDLKTITKLKVAGEEPGDMAPTPLSPIQVIIRNQSGISATVDFYGVDIATSAVEEKMRWTYITVDGKAYLSGDIALTELILN
jgi:hypothetical protein